MKNYDYQKQLEAVWKKAVDLYAKGNRDAGTYFDAAETAFLDSIGVTAREVYDFAEDWNASQEPDLATFLTVHDIRRAYFLEVMKGQRTGKQVSPDVLPPKTSEVRGIHWLPRIIPKAKAKLRGEMSPELMYGCGGDRRFFKENDIHPAEFLRVVWEKGDDDNAVIDWVEQRRKK